MPRNWVRKFPKTTGVVLTGACGHTYTDRVNVPQSLVGTVRTAEGEAVLAEWLTIVEHRAAKQDCRTCEAGTSIEYIREQAEGLTRLLDMPAPAPLSGTARQVAYAERLRFAMLRQAADVAVPAAWRSTLGGALLLGGDGGRHSDDIVALYRRAVRAKHEDPADPARVAEVLLGWLLGRAAVREAFEAIDWEDTAAGWMRMRLGRGSKWLDEHTAGGRPNIGRILAAAAVASRTCWKDRFEAEAALSTLSSWPESSEVALLRDGEGEFDERVSALATMRALSQGSWHHMKALPGEL